MRLVSSVLLSIGLALASAARAQPSASEPAIGAAAPTSENGLALEVQGQLVEFDTFFATVLPGEILNLQARGRPSAGAVAFEAHNAGESVVDQRKLSWKAPQAPGLYPITVTDRETRRRATINVFVLTPLAAVKNGRLNGYRIGAYPDKPLRGNPAYAKPLGFIAVTAENADTKISPHFTIGEFLCKQTTKASVKYLVLRPALVMKLERIIAHLRANAVRADSIHVMSGYRTPFYNAAIKNVKYSRHVYGDAADIYIDVAPKDGDMDDLNEDGVVDKNDANFLYDLIDQFDNASSDLSARGGVGSYNRNAAHGPFVHVDVRGAPARWGR